MERDYHNQSEGVNNVAHRGREKKIGTIATIGLTLALTAVADSFTPPPEASQGHK